MGAAFTGVLVSNKCEFTPPLPMGITVRSCSDTVLQDGVPEVQQSPPGVCDADNVIQRLAGLLHQALEVFAETERSATTLGTEGFSSRSNFRFLRLQPSLSSSRSNFRCSRLQPSPSSPWSKSSDVHGFF